MQTSWLTDYYKMVPVQIKIINTQYYQYPILHVAVFDCLGLWYGIELERPVGKNDGSVNGQRYFTCKPMHGVFAPPTRLQR